MKSKLTIVLTPVLLLAGARWVVAADGAALYKTKCAGCHGAAGEGKPAMKAPALKDCKLSEDQLVTHLTKGEPASKPPHAKGLAGLKDDQAKSIAEYVKTLK